MTYFQISTSAIFAGSSPETTVQVVLYNLLIKNFKEGTVSLLFLVLHIFFLLEIIFSKLIFSKLMCMLLCILGLYNKFHWH